MRNIDNPFEKLGIRKDLVEHLHRTGQLEDYLNRYARLVQTKVHPDTSHRNDGLSYLVNEAISDIRDHSDYVPGWISSMHDFAALCRETERLRDAGRKVEEADRENRKLRKETAELRGEYTKLQREQTELRREYTELQREHAEILIERDRKTTSPAPEKYSSWASALLGEKAESFRDDKTGTSRRAEVEEEPIVLYDIVLYDAKGNPCRTYKRVSLDGEAAKYENGEYLRQTQDEWDTHWKKRGRVQPSLPLWRAIIERMHEDKHPGLVGILRDLQKHPLMTSTRINYATNIVTHDKRSSFEYSVLCKIPYGRRRPNIALIKDKDEQWLEVLQALLLYQDVDRTVSMLDNAFEMQSYVIPAEGTRLSAPARAALLDVNSDGFYIDCSSGLLHFTCCSRSMTIIN